MDATTDTMMSVDPPVAPKRAPPTLLTLPRELLEYIVRCAEDIDDGDDDDLFIDDSESDEDPDASIDLLNSPNAKAAPPPKPETPTKATGIARWTLNTLMSNGSPSKTSPSPEEEEEAKAVEEYRSSSLIESLYLTNRELHEICKPIFWRRIDFEGDTNASLKRFESIALDKYASYMRELYLRQNPDDSERHFHIDDEEEAPRGSFKRKPRLAFLLRVLSACPALEDIDIDIHTPEDDTLVQQQLARTFEGITRHAATLTTLALTDTTGATANVINQPWLATLLKPLTQLKSLSLQDVGKVDHLDELPIVLASLPKLITLGFTNADLSPAWSGLTLPVLRHLELEDIGDAVGASPFSTTTQACFEDFICNHADQLASLRCDGSVIRNKDHEPEDLDGPAPTLETADEEALKTLPLSRLRGLCIVGPVIGQSLMSRFTGLATVAELNIGYTFLLHAADLIEYVRNREAFPRLKGLVVTERTVDDYADLLAQCAIRDIRCELVPPDPDEEDMDEDGFLDSDEEGWSEGDEIVDFFGDESGDEEWETDEHDEDEDSDEDDDSQGGGDDLE